MRNAIRPLQLLVAAAAALMTLPAGAGSIGNDVYEAHPARGHVLSFSEVSEIPEAELLFYRNEGQFTIDHRFPGWVVGGLLVDKKDPSIILYELELFLWDLAVGTPPGSPVQVPAGADVFDWQYALSVLGYLYDPDNGDMLFGLRRSGSAAQLGYGANATNLDFGLASWLEVFDPKTRETFANHGDISISLTRPVR